MSILSDAWTFLILREAFFGARRFEEFRSALDLPRSTLTDRLRRLTHEGIFRESVYSVTPHRVEYKLTKSGVSLYPTIVALMQFGDRWLSGPKGGPLQLIHEECGCTSRPSVCCSACNQTVVATSVSYRDGPGAGKTIAETTRRSRRVSDVFKKGRPSSVARAVEIIGDRWSFLVLREAFFGAKTFDKLHIELNIATNILSDRLARLIKRGIIIKREDKSQPGGTAYRLTPMGMDLYGPIIAMMAWGDTWKSKGKPPLILTHLNCGSDFTPTVICDHCEMPIHFKAMKYRLRYDPEKFGGPKSDRLVPGRP